MAGDGQLQAVDRQMLPALLETIEALPLAPEDVALTRVAQGYARQLDAAAGAAARADRVLARLGNADEELLEVVQALRAKLAERIAWEALGPRLLAALVELGASPKARAAVAGKGKPATAPGGGALAGLRSARTS